MGVCALWSVTGLAKTEKRKAKAGKTEEVKTVCNCTKDDGSRDRRVAPFKRITQSSPTFHHIPCHLLPACSSARTSHPSTSPLSGSHICSVFFFFPCTALDLSARFPVTLDLFPPHIFLPQNCLGCPDPC